VKKILLAAFADEEEKISEDGESDDRDDEQVVAKEINVTESVIHFFLVYSQGMSHTTCMREESYYNRRY
jgi:hypothetical protein